jgi:hypothetical protein
MWRIALVTLAVAGGYFALPRFAPDAPSASDADSFGSPWTVSGLVAAFQAEGVPLEITNVTGTVDDVLPGAHEPVLQAKGTLGASPVTLLIYRSEAARKSTWLDAPPAPAVSVRGALAIPEFYAFGAANAVVLGVQSSRRDYQFVQSEMLALRNR